MRRTKTLLAAAIVLAAALAATAEVALDEVVQAGRFVLYRDHADAHKYYYVPDEPRLATKRDGTPEFTFIKYTKTDGATKGGIIHFLVTWGLTEGELSSAESALRLKDPEARIAGPVPFKEGTFKVVSATAGEGGIFNRKIVGEGKAPILPGLKAAVSIALTEEGASLLWESFKNPASDISVMFALKFTGLTPAFQAKLKVNWDKVYTQNDIKLHAEGTIKVVKLQADVRAILEELRQQGAIQLEVVGENPDMQKMLDVVYGHLITLMCEKVPVGAGETAKPPAKTPAKKRPMPEAVADWPDAPPAWSLNVLAGVIRSADERLRGGPFADQDRDEAQRSAAARCDEPSRQTAASFAGRAEALIRERKYAEAVEMYQQAYDACPEPGYLYEMADLLAFGVLDHGRAKTLFSEFLKTSEGLSEYADRRAMAQAYLNDCDEFARRQDLGYDFFNQGKYAQAHDEFRWLYDHLPQPWFLFNLGVCAKAIGDETGGREDYQRAMEYFQDAVRLAKASPNPERFQGDIESAELCIEALRPILDQAAAAKPQTEQGQVSAEEARRQRRQQAQQAAQKTQAGQAQAAGGGQQTTSTGAAVGGTKPPAATTEAGTQPPSGQTQAESSAGGLGRQTLWGRPGTKPSGQAGGTKPPSGQTQATKPGAKPGEKGKPEIKPIISAQIGYTFKRIKMSGSYEVDLRKRIHEDRDVAMSGNISGIYQTYGEDPRFFSVVSLDDPTFQERSIEVILDGQDASDFKDYVNAVSVLFRKQRFSGPPTTGEVKFIERQFAQSGNCQSFKYGRLNEASTEWLDYEYKPKWSFYGGVEWEGDWTKTPDSVLTLSPPVRRRTLQISVDEDNILKNNIKALAIQIRHHIYGQDILKEVVINYDKGDPLQTDYTYLHEDGKSGYSYKVIWLLLDGREIQTDWIAKDSPFIYAVYAKK
jgi:tetratricopeptide (TPR) repeat protein